MTQALEIIDKIIRLHNPKHHYPRFITKKNMKSHIHIYTHNIFQPGRVVTILPSSDPEVSAFKLFWCAYSRMLVQTFRYMFLSCL